MDHTSVIKELLSSVLEDNLLDIQSVGSDENLVEAGLNSLRAISFVILIEDKFDIALEDEDLLFENINTITKINTLINKYSSKTTHP